mmetsp:Transcript_413/g.657  ORF Transcript_413/g.657 Transcript_413/m.657 type:complete len:493 (+) Transcript_413:593-2071(+)
MESNGEASGRVEGKGELCVADELVEVHMEKRVDDRFIVGGDGGEDIVVEFGIVVRYDHAMRTGLCVATASVSGGGDGAIDSRNCRTAGGIEFIFHGKDLFVKLAFTSSPVRGFLLSFLVTMDILTHLVIVAECAISFFKGGWQRGWGSRRNPSGHVGNFTTHAVFPRFGERLFHVPYPGSVMANATVTATAIFIRTQVPHSTNTIPLVNVPTHIQPGHQQQSQRHQPRHQMQRRDEHPPPPSLTPTPLLNRQTLLGNPTQIDRPIRTPHGIHPIPIHVHGPLTNHGRGNSHGDQLGRGIDAAHVGGGDAIVLELFETLRFLFFENFATHSGDSHVFFGFLCGGFVVVVVLFGSGDGFIVSCVGEIHDWFGRFFLFCRGFASRVVVIGSSISSISSGNCFFVFFLGFRIVLPPGHFIFLIAFIRSRCGSCAFLRLLVVIGRDGHSSSSAFCTTGSSGLLLFLLLGLGGQVLLVATSSHGGHATGSGASSSSSS